MVSVVVKTVKGVKYKYIVKSVRLPNGAIKTIWKKLSSGEKRTKKLESKYADFFVEKEKKLFADYAKKIYKTSYIFSEEEISKIESMRVSYKYILKKIGKQNLKDIFDRFTINFTYDSNAIEGNSLTLKDVKIIILEEDEEVKGRNPREIYETRNSKKVIDLILKRKFDISHKDIIKIHKILMTDIDMRFGYKEVPNVIFREEREVQTTPPEKVEEEMTKVINWYKKSKGNLHPLEIATIFHGRFEKIHPFQDGNGRVGRFLINLILVKNGYPPMIIRKMWRTSYLNALRAFDSGHEDKLKRFFLEKFKLTYRNFFETYARYI